MSKASKKRLMRNYDWDGKSTEGLARKIALSNYERMSKTALNRDKKNLEAGFKRALPKRARERPLAFPEPSAVINDSTLMSVKAIQNGKATSATRQRAVMGAVRETLDEMGLSTQRGNVPKNFHKRVARKLTAAYEPYAKNDPRYGRPADVQRTAVTESRTLVNNLRRIYSDRAESVVKEEGFRVDRSWLHNPGMSKEPRGSHAAMNGVKAVNGFYVLKGENGTYRIAGPHDPSLPAEEVIYCHCEEKILYVRK